MVFWGRVLISSPFLLISTQIVASHCCAVVQLGGQLKVDQLLPVSQENTMLHSQPFGHTVSHRIVVVLNALGVCLGTMGPTLGANFM